MRDDDGLDDGDRKLLDNIERYGWHVVLIPADAEGPSYGFSVGMEHTLRHPEVCVFGLAQAVAHRVINAIGEKARAGDPVPLQMPGQGFLEGYPVQFRPVKKQWYRDYFGSAGWFYRSDEFRVLQCIWPDKSGWWPWDAEFNALWKSQQPLLT